MESSLSGIFYPTVNYHVGCRIQDVCLVFSLIIVFLSFFSTYVFQAGLVGLLVSRYKVPIMVSIAYLGLSIAYHVTSLNSRWYEPQVQNYTIDNLVGCKIIVRRWPDKKASLLQC